MPKKFSTYRPKRFADYKNHCMELARESGRKDPRIPTGELPDDYDPGTRGRTSDGNKSERESAELLLQGHILRICGGNGSLNNAHAVVEGVANCAWRWDVLTVGQFRELVSLARSSDPEVSPEARDAAWHVLRKFFSAKDRDRYSNFTDAVSFYAVLPWLAANDEASRLLALEILAAFPYFLMDAWSCTGESTQKALSAVITFATEPDISPVLQSQAKRTLRSWNVPLYLCEPTLHAAMLKEMVGPNKYSDSTVAFRRRLCIEFLQTALENEDDQYVPYNWEALTSAAVSHALVEELSGDADAAVRTASVLRGVMKGGRGNGVTVPDLLQAGLLQRLCYLAAANPSPATFELALDLTQVTLRSAVPTTSNPRIIVPPALRSFVSSLIAVLRGGQDDSGVMADGAVMLLKGLYSSPVKDSSLPSVGSWKRALLLTLTTRAIDPTTPVRDASALIKALESICVPSGCSFEGIAEQCTETLRWMEAHHSNPRIAREAKAALSRVGGVGAAGPTNPRGNMPSWPSALAASVLDDAQGLMLDDETKDMCVAALRSIVTGDNIDAFDAEVLLPLLQTNSELVVRGVVGLLRMHLQSEGQNGGEELLASAPHVVDGVCSAALLAAMQRNAVFLRECLTVLEMLSRGERFADTVAPRLLTVLRRGSTFAARGALQLLPGLAADASFRETLTRRGVLSELVSWGIRETDNEVKQLINTAVASIKRKATKKGRHMRQK